jgi:hypothetical protein
MGRLNWVGLVNRMDIKKRYVEYLTAVLREVD